MALMVEPAPLHLNKHSKIYIRVTIRNEGKKMIALRFNTTQQIELFLLDQGGKQMARWSSNYHFEPTYTALTINPGERAEFEETLSTKGMKPAIPYILQLSVPGYPELTVRSSVRPLP